MSGFYYHTADFDAKELIQKCIKRLDNVPADVDGININFRKEAPASEIIQSNFTEEWVAPNYTDSIVEYDTPISELNEKSKEKEIERLAESKGQYFVVEVSAEAGENAYTISALVEIRGRAAGGKTEFYVEEFRQGPAGMQE